MVFQDHEHEPAHERGKGIWRYADSFRPRVGVEHRLTLGEGGTALVSVEPLARRVGVREVWIKRDDLSPGGSHKARSLAYRVSLGLQRGEKHLCISSSGNAAVAASLYSARAGMCLYAFVSPETPLVKRIALEREGTIVIESVRPRNLARYAGRLFGMSNLTPSIDDASIEGFKSIAGEMGEAGVSFQHLFTFATSGSSLVGIGRMFAAEDGSPALHAVQSGVCCPIAGPSDPRFLADGSCGEIRPSLLAGLLTVDETPRSEEARRRVAGTGGRGWVQRDEEILEARAWLRDCGVDTSPEGAACLSAVHRARCEGAVLPCASIVVVLTGHGSQWPSVPASSSALASMQQGPSRTCRCDTYGELRSYLGQWLPERPCPGANPLRVGETT